MWVLYSISPTTFNVLSELTGRVIEAAVLAVLGYTYPFLVHAAVVHGAGVPLDSIVTPPHSLIDALKQLRQGGSRALLVGMLCILAVLTVSHSIANTFLDFVTVDVGTNDAFFLGNYPGGVPTYALLGDQYAEMDSLPATPGARLVQQADSIAQGLSRFSFLPPDTVDVTEKTELLSGLVAFQKSTLNPAYSDLPNITIKPIERHLDVLCQSSPYEKLSSDSNDNNGTNIELFNGTVIEYIYTSYEYSDLNNSELLFTSWAWFKTIPVCDYENSVSYSSIEEPSTDFHGWSILEYSSFSNGSSYNPVDNEAFGIRDGAGDLRWFIDLSLNESALAFTRGDFFSSTDDGTLLGEPDGIWQYGRRIRDGLTLAIGLRPDLNETHRNWFEPNLPFPDGVEFQVDYSVLVGPSGQNKFASGPNYVISSWSHNCPAVSAMGNLTVASFPLQNVDMEVPSKTRQASGCIIDSTIQCDSLFPQDNPTGIEEASPSCWFGRLDITLLSGIEVDPFMLAAYAGIATRNDALGRLDSLKHHFALNSIAAAYIMTREVVPGTHAADGVRAKIDPGFVVFMLLPLIFIVPLLCFKENKPLPVPRNNWELLVFARQEKSIPKLREDSTFPPCPSNLNYGFISDDGVGHGHLGLRGSSSVKIDQSKVSPTSTEHHSTKSYEICEV